MTLLWIAIGTVEVCVLLFILAAAVLALAIRPGGKAPAETYFYAGDLMTAGDSQPEIVITIGDDYRAAIMRRGIDSVIGDDGAASLAVTVTATDVTIEERLTPGKPNIFNAESIDSAMFFIDCLPPNTRIHLRYNASASSRSASCSFTVKPGFRYRLPLTQ